MREIYSITVLCAKCRARLYDYNKEGPGSLIKCFVSNITKDYTQGDLKCPDCHQQFAREATIHNRPAHKIIQGKVTVRGHHG